MKQLLTSLVIIFSSYSQADWSCFALRQVSEGLSGKVKETTQIELTKTRNMILSGKSDNLILEAMPIEDNLMTGPGVNLFIKVNEEEAYTSSGISQATLGKMVLSKSTNEVIMYQIACIDRDVHPDAGTPEGILFQRLRDLINEDQ